LATAIRETLEETAIDLTEARLLGRLDDLAPLTPTLPPIMVRPFVFGVDVQPQIRPNVEVAAHRWVPLGDLHRSEGVTTVQARGISVSVHAYQLGTDIVWGMTHRILTPLVKLLDAWP
jgi:8-oxo-dGTP pyrophosphatase MutT (NUDIX family)